MRASRLYVMLSRTEVTVMSNENIVLSLQNVSYTYAMGTPYQIKALDDVSVDIKKGVVTGIIGHTGSGKSTLVQLLNGLIKPDSGKILLNGTDIWEKPKEISKVRFKVGLVMQYPEYQLFEETVAKDIAYGPTNMGIEGEALEALVKESAEFAGVDAELLEKSPFDLSGGQKRRVAIAGIMAMRPDILVLDEPAAGLDPRGKSMILSGIREYQKKTGSSVIIVSHSMEDMAKYCDELVVLSDSKVIMQGDPDHVFSDASTLISVGLDVPAITKLMSEIKARGFDVCDGVYTVDKAFDELIKLFNK